MKFSLSIRVDKITPAHVYLSVFSAMVPDEYDHNQVTRGKSGDLVLRVDEVWSFLDRVKPDILTCEDPEMFWSYTGVSI